MKCQICGAEIKEGITKEPLVYNYCEKPRRLTTYFYIQQKAVITPAEDHPNLCDKCFGEELKLVRILMGQP